MASGDMLAKEGQSRVGVRGEVRGRERGREERRESLQGDGKCKRSMRTERVTARDPMAKRESGRFLAKIHDRSANL